MIETTSTERPKIQRISGCTGCEQALPLRLTLPGEEPVGWTCSSCGAPFLAVLDDSAEAALHRNVRVSDMLFADCRRRSVPQGMLNFLSQVASRDNHDERRDQRRFAVNIQATAIPVDERLSPVGEAFSAMTTNISQSGLALLHTRSVIDRFLLVELEDPQRTQVVIEVIRSQHTGRFYDIAGRFVMRFGNMPQSA